MSDSGVRSADPESCVAVTGAGEGRRGEVLFQVIADIPQRWVKLASLPHELSLCHNVYLLRAGGCIV